MVAAGGTTTGSGDDGDIPLLPAWGYLLLSLGLLGAMFGGKRRPG